MTLSTLALFFQDATTTLANPPLGAPPAGANSSAFTEMIHNSGPMALAVLGILLVCSIFSWSIMISKWRSFGAAEKQGGRFVRAFRKSGRLSEIAAIADQFRPSPLVTVFHEITDEYQRQSGGRGMPRNPQALERA